MKKIDISNNIKNILPDNDRSKLVNCNGDDFFRKQGRKLTSSQASGGKHPNRTLRVQASSQNSQALRSRDQGTSAQAQVSGRKQQE